MASQSPELLSGQTTWFLRTAPAMTRFSPVSSRVTRTKWSSGGVGLGAPSCGGLLEAEGRESGSSPSPGPGLTGLWGACGHGHRGGGL